METVIKQAEENRQRSMSMANRFHEEYVPLKGEIDTMRREYLGLERLPELHEEEGSIITPEYDFENPTKSHDLLTIFNVFSRFQAHQNFYSSKISNASGGFTRPTPVQALTNAAQGPHHPLPPNDPPHITPLNPSHGFLPPAPPQSVGQGLRGLQSVSKPTEISSQTSRIQQATSLGMHPTFRSDFNVPLRYLIISLYYFSL